MNKTFIYAVIVVIVGVAGWFFVQKFRNSSEDDQADVQDSEITKVEDSDDKNVSKEGKWVKLEGGLQYQDVVIGTGQEAKNGDAIAAHYLGTLEDGAKFDSSYDRGQPFAFILGKGSVIKGWDIGVAGMKVGGKRKLIIPSDLGYGARGVSGGQIPPNAILLFDIELVGVQTPNAQQ